MPEEKIDVVLKEMREGFSRVDREMKAGFGRVEKRLGNIEETQDRIIEKLVEHDNRLDKLDTTLDEHTRILGRLDSEHHATRVRLDRVERHAGISPA